jgi:hypothetical protein
MKTMKQKENDLKEGESLSFDWNGLSQFLNSTSLVNQWNTQEKVKLFASYFIKPELVDALENEEDDIQK